MPDNREVRVRISGEDKTTAAFLSVQKGMAGLRQSASSVNSALLAIGAGVSVGGVIALGKAAIDTADNFNKMAQRVGASTEFLSKLAYAAKLGDVGTEAMELSIRQLTKAMAAAQSGSTEQLAAFKAIGVSATDVGGNLRPVEAVLLDIADAFARSEDGPGKTAASMKLLGRAGSEMIPVLNSGSDALRGLFDEADRAGAVISGPTAQAAERFNDSMLRLETGFRGATLQIVSGLLPTLDRLSGSFFEAGKHGEGLRSMGAELGSVFSSIARGSLAAALGVSELYLSLERVVNSKVNRVGGLVSSGLIPFIGPSNRSAAEIEAQRTELRRIYAEQLNSLEGVAGSPAATHGATPLGGEKKKIQFFDNEALAASNALLDKNLALLARARKMLAQDDFVEKAGIDYKQMGDELERAAQSAGKLTGQMSEQARIFHDEGNAREIKAWNEFLDKFSSEAKKSNTERLKSIRFPIAPESDIAKVGGTSYYAGSLEGDANERLRGSLEQINLAFAGTRQYTLDAVNLLDAFGQAGSTVFEDLALGTRGFGQAMQSLAASVASSIARMVAQFAIMRIASSFLGLFSPSIASQTGSISGLGKLALPLGNISIATPHAMGGAFAAGEQMLVGERGPEIVKFGSAGTVIPNSQLRSSGGGATYNISVDARGSQMSPEEMFKVFRKALAATQKNAVREINEQAIRR